MVGLGLGSFHAAGGGVLRLGMVVLPVGFELCHAMGRGVLGLGMVGLGFGSCHAAAGGLVTIA